MGFDISLILFCFSLVTMVTCGVCGLYFFHFFCSRDYILFHFFYFIASWKGLVLGCICTGCLSFTWGVVYFTVSHLFGFQFPLFRSHLTYPLSTCFGAFATSLILLFPQTLMSIHIITPTWFKKKIFPMTKKNKKNEYMKWYEELIHTKA